MRTFAKAAAAAALMVLTATGAASASPHPASHPCTANDIRVSGAVGQTPTIGLPTDCSAPTSLISKDLVTGTGPAARPGDQLTMNYELVAWSTKQVADSSFSRHQPFAFKLGAGEVIPGWDRGLVGIKKGGRRLLIVPPALGYGAQGMGGAIHPNETLLFIADAVSIKH